MELWQLMPQGVRINALAIKLTEFTKLSHLEKCWRICEINVFNPDDEKIKELFLQNFFIINIFICDFAFFVKFGNTVTRRRLSHSFLERTVFQIPDIEFKNHAQKILESLGRQIQSTESEKEFDNKVAEIFLRLVNQENNKDLKNSIAVICFSTFHDICSLLDESIRIGHLFLK